jgi:hypothetical protein
MMQFYWSRVCASASQARCDRAPGLTDPRDRSSSLRGSTVICTWNCMEPSSLRTSNNHESLDLTWLWMHAAVGKLALPLISITVKIMIQ